MITALLDDRPLAAGELARVAGVSPATASAHLARLLSGGLVTMIKQGRHRYYQLAGPEVAAAMEALAHLTTRPRCRCAACGNPATPPRWPRPGPVTTTWPGRAGVALLEALLARGILAPAPGGGQLAACGPNGGASPETAGGPSGRRLRGRRRLGRAPAATAAPRRRRRSAPRHSWSPRTGMATLTSFGLNIGALEQTRRRFAGACLDWTERKPHLNGALGAAMTARLLGLGWIERGVRRRAVRVTPAGREGLAATFGWSLED